MNKKIAAKINKLPPSDKQELFKLIQELEEAKEELEEEDKGEH